MEDLERYLDEAVDPTSKDFEQNPTSVLHAFIAWVATFHSVDYLAYPQKSRAARQRFRTESPDFRARRRRGARGQARRRRRSRQTEAAGERGHLSTSRLLGRFSLGPIPLGWHPYGPYTKKEGKSPRGP